MFYTVRNKTKTPQLIIDQIRNAILAGKLLAGDKLPSEQELTVHFEVSRQTLREAMRALEYLGLLDIRAGAGGGAFVSEVDIQTTRNNLANFLHFKNLSVNHISEIRKVLEPYAARVAAEKMTADDLKNLEMINIRTEEALTGGDLEAMQRNGLEFHRAIANASCNPILIFILDFVENLIDDVKQFLKPDADFFIRVIEAHNLIWYALAERDPDRAAEEMAKDVSNVEEDLIKLAEGRPVIKWS